MRYQLEPLMRIGARQVAVISRIEAHHHRLFGADTFLGEKAPAFFILADEGKTELLDASGSRVAREDVESICPEIAAAAFEILKSD